MLKRFISWTLALALMFSCSLASPVFAADSAAATTMRLERTEDGVTLSMTNRSKQPEPEQAEQPTPEPSASAQTGTETAAPQQTTQQPTQGAYVGSGTKLNIVSAPESSDTTFSDEEDALCLQDIYSSVIDSVVSISSMTSSGTSSGTGIIMSSDGYVITNHHVISGASSVTVTMYDGTEYPATERQSGI